MDHFFSRKSAPLPDHIITHLRRLQLRLQHDEPLKPKLFSAPIVTPDMLDWDMMLGEALKGIDIFKKYPDFYLTLLGNTILRQNFISDLQMLIQLDQEPLFSPPADAPPPDLSFLNNLQRFRWKAVPPAEKASISSPIVYLQQAIFNPELLNPNTYRSTAKEDGFQLMHGSYTVGKRQLKIDLMGTLDADGYYLTPDLWIGPDDGQPAGAYMVHLSWDGYDDVQTVELELAKEFLPIEVDTIINAESGEVLADLQLSFLSLDD